MSTITATTKEDFETFVSNGTHHIVSDEPIELGGTDKGLTPTELLQSSLGTCSSITMKMYANRKKWKIDQIEVEVLALEEISTNELYLKKKIRIKSELDNKQLEKMLIIAGKCPIHKILSKSIEIKTELL